MMEDVTLDVDVLRDVSVSKLWHRPTDVTTIHAGFMSSRVLLTDACSWL
jgi:hypothetical protein